ncbi:hypothetical protein KRX11_10215 [Pasteurellaceae bacterium TAE3-ERU1]|nr:hypothetical protein [Pasteurellaceae bacterium TAE3-ERU1]
MLLTLELDKNLIKNIIPKGHGSLIELKVPINALTVKDSPALFEFKQKRNVDRYLIKED